MGSGDATRYTRGDHAVYKVTTRRRRTEALWEEEEEHVGRGGSGRGGEGQGGDDGDRRREGRRQRHKEE